MNSFLVFIATVLASGPRREKNYHYWRTVNITSCITGVDLDSTCDIEDFPSSPSNIIQDVNYCCQQQKSFHDYGFCEAGEEEAGKHQYNVPVCHSLTSMLKGISHLEVISMTSHLSAGAPENYRKIELECDDNSSLLVLDELRRPTMNCMLQELIKASTDNAKYCLRESHHSWRATSFIFSSFVRMNLSEGHVVR